MGRPSRRMVLALWGMTGLFWVTIFIATHLPPRNLPPVRVSDKTAHLLGYFVLTGLLYVSWWASNPRRQGLWLIVLLVVASYATFDELLQVPVGRTADLADWVADMVGAAAALLICSAMRWWMLWRQRKDVEAAMRRAVKPRPAPVPARR